MMRLRHRTFRELRERGVGQLRILAERAGVLMDAREPSPRRMGALLEAGLSTDGPGIAEDIVRSCRAILPGLAEPGQSAAALAADWPADAEAILDRAARLVAGRFDLLGYDALEPGAPPDWHRDPVSGRSAPLRHWSRIPYLDAAIVGDHKVTWELNRHQYLVTLAQAWLLSGNEQYPATIAAHLESWMDHNPPKQGINWASSLEVGFRAISWIWTLALAGDALPASLVQRCAGMLHVHACHLESNLSTWFSPNTHLTGEALALAYLGRALPVFRRSERWRETGLRILEDEVRRQVLPDGVYFEQATYYHRYTTDFYLHAALLLDAQGTERPHWLDVTLRHLLDYLVATVRPDGSWPLIGDEDGGRLVWLKSRQPNDFHDTLGLGAVLLGRREYCLPGSGAPSELAWLLGPGAGARFEALGSAVPPSFAIFPDGGYAVLRNEQGDWLLMEAGPHGGLAGGHAHSDALAIELAVAGATVLQDAGTFTYVADPAARDAFRAGAAHSTLTIDGHSAAVPAGPFRWRHRSEARFERWLNSARFDFLSARQDGFGGLAPGVIHHRELLWLRDWKCWIIRDRVEGTDAPFEAHFHTAPGIIVATRRETAMFRDAGANRLRLDVLAEQCALAVSDSWHSPGYGVRVPAQLLTVQVMRGRELVTVLRAGPSQFTWARDVTGTTVTLEHGGRVAEVAAGPAGWRLDGQRLDSFGD
ncbi:MAG TPA: alginate lyase family protein [Gemmatimonadales bacterium]|nr:alginate lyase family protein [Gemmatimonadales bacterium]